MSGAAIGWLIFAGYMVVAALTARALVRVVMSRPVCTIHKEGWFTGKCFSNFDHTEWGGKTRSDYRRVPLGELQERPLMIGLLAALAGLVWPLTGLVAIAMHAPRTPDEMSRRNREMADVIEQLEKQLRSDAS